MSIEIALQFAGGEFKNKKIKTRGFTEIILWNKAQVHSLYERPNHEYI